MITDDNAPAASKTKWLAVFYLCIPTGYALGYIFGGLVAIPLGWRAPFLLEAAAMVPFVIFCCVAPPIDIKGTKEQGGVPSLDQSQAPLCYGKVFLANMSMCFPSNGVPSGSPPLIHYDTRSLLSKNLSKVIYPFFLSNSMLVHGGYFGSWQQTWLPQISVAVMEAFIRLSTCHHH